jgi:hypothetical protein
MLNTFYKTVFERSFARLWAQAVGTGESMMCNDDFFKGNQQQSKPIWVQQSAQAEPLVLYIYKYYIQVFEV